MPNVVGWLLVEPERSALIARLPPTYPDLVPHHVTLKAKAPSNEPWPTETGGEIVGVADDGEGVQAMVVRIGGTTDRPDGSTYHITWSLDRSRGRTAVESNEVIRRLGWKAFDPIAITLKPGRF